MANDLSVANLDQRISEIAFMLIKQEDGHLYKELTRAAQQAGCHTADLDEAIHKAIQDTHDSRLKGMQGEIVDRVLSGKSASPLPPPFNYLRWEKHP